MKPLLLTLASVFFLMSSFAQTNDTNEVFAHRSGDSDNLLLNLSTHQHEKVEDSNTTRNDRADGSRQSAAGQLVTHQPGWLKLRPLPGQSTYQQDSTREGAFYTVPRSVVHTSTRITTEPPADGLYERVEVIDMEEYKKRQLVNQLASHQIKGQRVYIDREWVTGLMRKGFDSDIPLDDTRFVAEAELDTIPPDMIPLDRYLADQGLPEHSSDALLTVVKDEAGNITKAFRITKNGEYQYYDGKEIVGGEKYQEAFADGFKPITPITFFYELQDSNRTAFQQDVAPSDFAAMTVEEQVEMVKEALKQPE